MSIPYTICNTPNPKAQKSNPCPGKNNATRPNNISDIPKNLTSFNVYFSALNNAAPYTNNIIGANSI